MNTVVICNTFYQFIVAYQLKRTIFKEDNVYLIVSDQTKALWECIKRISSINYFSGVVPIKTKFVKNRKKKIIGLIKDIHDMISPKQIFDSLGDISIDRIIYYNYDDLALALYTYAVKKNSKIEVARYEEGILSYNFQFPYKRIKVLCSIQKLFLGSSLRTSTSSFYCTYPDAYNGDMAVNRIPKIDFSPEDIERLRYIFSINIEKNQYKEKYIFLTSMYDFEGGSPIHEKEIVDDIKKIVGKDNLLVKLHPRDVRGVYSNQEYNIDSNSRCPWEIILLTTDLSNKVILTATSGSAMSTNLMIDNGPKVYFLYKLCDISTNQTAQYTVNTIDKIMSNVQIKKMLNNVIVVKDSVNEVLN